MTTLLRMDEFNFKNFEKLGDFSSKENMMIDYVITKGDSGYESIDVDEPEAPWFSKLVDSKNIASINGKKEVACGWTWTNWHEWMKYLNKKEYIIDMKIPTNVIAKQSNNKFEEKEISGEKEESGNCDSTTENKIEETVNYFVNYVKKNYTSCYSVVEKEKSIEKKGKIKKRFELEMKIRPDNVRKVPSDQINAILNRFIKNVVTCRQCGNKRKNKVNKNKKMRNYGFKCSTCGSSYSID